MLPEIEQLANDYFPTVPFIRKDLKILYYKCPGVYHMRVFEDDNEADEIFEQMDIYRYPEKYINDTIAYIHSSFFRSKNHVRGNHGICAECGDSQGDYVIFCQRCWKTKTAKDAYQVVDECVKKIQNDKIDKKNFMNETIHIPKKIKLKVRDTTSQNELSELKEFTLVTLKK